eukprot:5042134-Alexandrium_andersonii.AAC.1
MACEPSSGREQSRMAAAPSFLLAMSAIIARLRASERASAPAASPRPPDAPPASDGPTSSA